MQATYIDTTENLTVFFLMLALYAKWQAMTPQQRRDRLEQLLNEVH